MKKYAEILFVLVSSCGAAVAAFAQNPNIPALSEQPGQTAFRAPDGSYGIESIDPFTGALKIVTTDLVVPSNGGLDITIVRNYVSTQKSNTTQPGYIGGRTATGIGWDIHFGRLWRGSTTVGFLPEGSNCQGSLVSQADARHNPVLELPDGSRQVLVTANTGKPYQFITREQWIGRCLPTTDPGDGGLEIVSPQGIKYIFNKLGRVAEGTTVKSIAFLPTRIEHPNGTYLTISYVAPVVPNSTVEFMRLEKVTHSEGQEISFVYSEPTTRNARLHEIKLNSPSRTWTYNYTQGESTGNGGYYHYLTEVQRPDGESTNDEYHTSSPGLYSLKKITTPLKATISYTYKSQTFPRHVEGATPVIAVATKTIGGEVDAGATWTYTYEPADVAGEITDITKVEGPTNCILYEHQSATSGNGQLWRIGLLLNKRVRASCAGSDLRHEQFTWTNYTLAVQNYWSPPDVSDTDTYVPILQLVAITQDGTSYTTKKAAKARRLPTGHFLPIPRNG